MEKKYQLIEEPAGYDLKKAVEFLQKHFATGHLVKLEWNGVMLYSDTVTLDSAYRECVGEGYLEFLKDQEKREQERKEREEKFQANFDTYVDVYKKSGRELLDPSVIALWDECIPIRLNDIYHGVELGGLLDIAKCWKEAHDLDACKKIFEAQGHSGMSAQLMMAMILSFIPEGGKEIVEKIFGE